MKNVVSEIVVLSTLWLMSGYALAQNPAVKGDRAAAQGEKQQIQEVRSQIKPLVAQVNELQGQIHAARLQAEAAARDYDSAVKAKQSIEVIQAKYATWQSARQKMSDLSNQQQQIEKQIKTLRAQAGADEQTLKSDEMKLRQDNQSAHPAARGSGKP